MRYFIQGTELLFLGVGSYFDVKDQQIPTWFFPPFGVFGIICNITWRYQKFQDVFWGICIGCIFLLIGRMTEEEIGYGDGLGILILAILEGCQGVLFLVFPALMLSGIYGLGRLIVCHKSPKDTIPFFPFLLISLTGVIFL